MRNEQYENERDFLRFHNRLRMLYGIDAGAFPGTHAEWRKFDANPVMYFIRCDDATAKAIFAMMQLREMHMED